MPTTRYIEILSVQHPFPINTDTYNRPMFSFNLDALAESPVTDWEEDVVSILHSAGLATLGTDTYVGPLAVIPAGDGPYINVVDTGGSSPVETHNGVKYERLSAQIVVRAVSYTSARTRAQSIWQALDGLRGIVV